MSTCLCIGGLLIAADAAAWVLSAQSGDSRWVVYITSLTGVIVACCTMVVMIAPHVGRAITSLSATILPALAVIKKQNEELNKGTLSERIETLLEQNTKLQKAVEEDRERTEDANKKLHEIRNEFQNATLQHQEQREALIAELGAVRAELTAARAELTEARQEIAEFHRRDQAKLNTLTTGQVRQDVRIEQNKVALDSVTATVERIAGHSSDEIPVVKVDGPSDSGPPAGDETMSTGTPKNPTPKNPKGPAAPPPATPAPKPPPKGK